MCVGASRRRSRSIYTLIEKQKKTRRRTRHTDQNDATCDNNNNKSSVFFFVEGTLCTHNSHAEEACHPVKCQKKGVQISDTNNINNIYIKTFVDEPSRPKKKKWFVQKTHTHTQRLSACLNRTYAKHQTTTIFEKSIISNKSNIYIIIYIYIYISILIFYHGKKKK